ATLLYASKPYKEGRLLDLGRADLMLPVATPIAELLRGS
ncbi:MAG: hypothetical protein JWN04_608, partial [Myxococcaceae bacterium]|nr:hypothetical protein [Myxococcaceae bacterium]